MISSGAAAAATPKNQALRQIGYANTRCGIITLFGTRMDPPLLPTRKKNRIWTVLIVVACVCAVIVGLLGYGLYRLATSSAFGKMADQQFGDQNLKTAVALIELHKVRTGHYPQNLGELRYLGGWDSICLQSVRYVAAEDGSAYFVEVQRGWVGKPVLNMPPDFWHGTGFNPELGRREMSGEPNKAADRMPGSNAPGKGDRH